MSTPHYREVLLGLAVDGVAQGGKARALVGRGVRVVDVIGSLGHRACIR